MKQVDVAGHPVLLCRDQGHLKVKAKHEFITKTKFIYSMCLWSNNTLSRGNALKVVVQAYSSKCTHYGAPLASGHLEGGLIRWWQE